MQSQNFWRTLLKKITSRVFRYAFSLLYLLSLVGSTPLLAQTNRIINGTVTEQSTGEPVIGATVSVKGTTEGTITDFQGKYSIEVGPQAQILVFSFIGKTTIEETIGDRTIIDVSMKEESIGLEEVVAIGYGSIKKSDVTGSVSSISAEDIAKVPVTSIDQTLQGKVSGVQVLQLSAQPGGTTSIRVRGGSSIYAGNEPLFVIDGMPIDSRNAQSWTSSPTQNAMAGLSPNDIESIEILKDASATSIYGARGANGVVMITTKRGKAGKDVINFEAYYGIQKQAKSIDVMNATQYAILYDEAGRNTAIDNGETYEPVFPNPQSLGAGTDWQNEIYRTAPQQNYQLSFSGGDEKTTYAISGNYFDQEGIIVGSDFKRYALRANVDRKLRENLRVGTSISLSRNDANTVGSSTQGGFFPGVVNTALTISPALPVRDSTGQYTLTDPNADAWLDNPVAVTREVTAKSKNNRIMANTFAEYTLLDQFKFKVSLGIDQTNNVQDYYTPRFIYSGSFNDGQARYATFESTTVVSENTITWDRILQEKHSFNVLAGYTFQKTDQRSFIDVATGFPSDRLGHYGITDAGDIPSIYTGFGDEALISYLGRVNYVYDSRYLLTLTGRVDGSSKFGKDNKYGFFPSAAIAWRLSQEEFIKDLNIFYNLKLRASIGISGNDKIPNYQFIPTMESTTYYFNNNYIATGYSPERTGNDKLKWETSQQLDIGLDMAFLNGRIAIVADYYNKYTFDLLYLAETPYTSGFANSFLNVGSMVNNGFEFGLNTANFEGKFDWSTDFNIAFNKSRVTDLNNNDATYISNDEYKLKLGYWSVIDVGEELGSFYGLVSDGIWQKDEADKAAIYGKKPGDFKYKDLVEDNIINEKDRKVIGHAQPDFIFSLNNNFSFGNFELSAFINGVYGNDILNANRFELESGNGLSNASIDMLNRWTPDNPSNTYPRASRNADYLRMSDRYLEDGSYIRLQLLTLAYNLPASLTNRAKIQGARIYVSAKNLLTITNYTGFDPEVGRFEQSAIRQGYDYGGYPSSKTWLIGISINL